MQGLGRGDGAHSSVFTVLRKRRLRGESHEGVVEVEGTVMGTPDILRFAGRNLDEEES